MATSIPTSPKRGPRVRESARDGEIGRDAQYDLLTAALIGAAIGATATLLLRRGPSGSRPVTPVLRGAKWAGVTIGLLAILSDGMNAFQIFRFGANYFWVPLTFAGLVLTGLVIAFVPTPVYPELKG